MPRRLLSNREEFADAPAGYRPASGGRTWWAHFEVTRINTPPTIRPKKIEDLPEAGASTSVPNRLACAADD